LPAGKTPALPAFFPQQARDDMRVQDLSAAARLLKWRFGAWKTPVTLIGHPYARSGGASI
jgi:hypothetical protein